MQQSANNPRQKPLKPDIINDLDNGLFKTACKLPCVIKENRHNSPLVQMLSFIVDYGAGFCLAASMCTSQRILVNNETVPEQYIPSYTYYNVVVED